MKRATPAQLRQALEVANVFVRHGIYFVCMPAVDEADRVNLAQQAASRLERLAVIAETEESQ